jgi:hypothetical protein
MTTIGWVQIFVFLGIIFAVTKPLGLFMTHVFSGERTFLDPALRPVERLIYRATGVDEKHEMRWTEYGAAMLLFSAVSMLLLYLIQRAQAFLPGNRRASGAEEIRAALGGHIPGDDTAVHPPADQRHFDSGRVDLFPGPEPGTDSRAPAVVHRKDFLRSVWRAIINRSGIRNSFAMRCGVPC